MWRKHNANPDGKSVGDCTVRAISAALGQSWEDTYWDLCEVGAELHDMPSANAVWGQYLKDCGFHRRLVPDDCPACYTVENFCREYPRGTYIVALSGHVVCIRDGCLYDTWDSSRETPIFYWEA